MQLILLHAVVCQIFICVTIRTRVVTVSLCSVLINTHAQSRSIRIGAVQILDEYQYSIRANVVEYKSDIRYISDDNPFHPKHFCLRQSDFT